MSSPTLDSYAETVPHATGYENLEKIGPGPSRTELSWLESLPWRKDLHAVRDEDWCTVPPASLPTARMHNLALMGLKYTGRDTNHAGCIHTWGRTSPRIMMCYYLSANGRLRRKPVDDWTPPEKPKFRVGPPW